MESISLHTEAAALMATARTAHAGRAAHTIHGGHNHFLRQTVIAMLGGQELKEHDSPGEATLQVLSGRVRLVVADEFVAGSTGDFIVIPAARHSLEAVEDSVVLLTVLADR